MNFFNVIFSKKKNVILYSTVIFTFVWYIIFGFNLSYEPYVWDDLHFFRKYNNDELRNIWIGNWDSDGIETPSYRPFAVLYYHLLYLIFEENTFLLRNFIIFEAFILVLISNKLLTYLNFNKSTILLFTLLIIFFKNLFNFNFLVYHKCTNFCLYNFSLFNFVFFDQYKE